MLLFTSLYGCNPKPDKELLSLSEQFLLEVKRDNPTTEIEMEFASLSAEELEMGLVDDNSKKVFWLNLYNAYFQRLGKSDSTIDLSIFKEPIISIADTMISFDDLEHGILRANSGYSFENLAVSEVDYRIHFALNCGAKSCPPIAFYNYKELDSQLENATKLFLIQTSTLNSEDKVINVSEVMDWFLEDFGGTHESLLTIVGSYLDQDLTGYTVQFDPWDWTAQFANFAD